MAADLDAFRERFPEAPFQPLDDEVVQQAIDDALLLHDKREEATLYLAAHLLALQAEEGAALEPDGGAGVVASEQIGPRRIQYLTQADGNARRSFYVTTPYGRMFLALEDRTARVGIGAMVV